MRLSLKRLLILITILMFPAFLLRMLLERSEIRQPSKTVQKKLDSQCAEEFKSLKLRNKLLHALTLGDPDTFMFIMKKFLPTCPLRLKYSSYGYGLIKPKLETKSTLTTNATNISFTIKQHEIKKSTLKPLCPPQSPLLRSHIDVNIPERSKLKVRKKNKKNINWPVTFEELAVSYPNLQLGGYHSGPQYCECRGYNAVIIPYRNKEKYLRCFLYYIHELLQRQQLCYIVIVSEQADDELFNKGQLMNTAFEHARKLMPFDCYIFHDVNIIAEDDRILYTCREDNLVHYAPCIEKHNYTLHDYLSIGAAVGFTEDQFLAVNGYSNEYEEWRGEDDDISKRIRAKKFLVWRSNKNYTSVAQKNNEGSSDATKQPGT